MDTDSQQAGIFVQSGFSARPLAGLQHAGFVSKVQHFGSGGPGWSVLSGRGTDTREGAGLAAVIAAAERRRVRRWRYIAVVGGGFVVWVVVWVVVV